jgi:hypothetical protein
MTHKISVQEALLFSKPIFACDYSLLGEESVRIFDVKASRSLKLLSKLTTGSIRVDYSERNGVSRNIKFSQKHPENIDIYRRTNLL